MNENQLIKTPSEQSLILTCLAEIESKQRWGSSEGWGNSDFETLSETIQEKTEVTLSVTTLKRIWGKAKYDNKPSITTLNALAQFLGYSGWREYEYERSQVKPSLVERETHATSTIASTTSALLQDQKPVNGLRPIAQQKPHRKIPVKLFAILAVLLSVTLLSFYIINHSKKQLRYDASKLQFSLNKVNTQGVPNSVVFSYDASKALSDSVFIVQTWDMNRKTLVPKDKKDFSAIYYYPGYFRTKLIIDSQIVKAKDLMIATDGWLAMVDQSPIPVYFSTDEVLRNGVIEVTAPTIEAHNISMEPKTPSLKLFNMRNMEGLMNNNFTFETTLRNDFNKGAGVCQSVQVLIQCKDDIIIIPLSAKACVGDLGLYFAGKQITSKDADLSKFGCNLGEWTTLRVESSNSHVKLYVNGEQAYALTFDHAPAGIVGVQYRFAGTGAVKDTKFTGGGKTYQF